MPRPHRTVLPLIALFLAQSPASSGAEPQRVKIAMGSFLPDDFARGEASYQDVIQRVLYRIPTAGAEVTFPLAITSF